MHIGDIYLGPTVKMVLRTQSYSRVPLTVQDGYRVTQIWFRYPPSPVSVRLVIRPKWTDIESLFDSISEQNYGPLSRLPRYPAGVNKLCLVIRRAVKRCNSLTALPDIRPTRYPPKMDG